MGCGPPRVGASTRQCPSTACRSIAPRTTAGHPTTRSTRNTEPDLALRQPSTADETRGSSRRSRSVLAVAGLSQPRSACRAAGRGTVKARERRRGERWGAGQSTEDRRDEQRDPQRRGHPRNDEADLRLPRILDDEHEDEGDEDDGKNESLRESAFAGPP